MDVHAYMRTYVMSMLVNANDAKTAMQIKKPMSRRAG